MFIEDNIIILKVVSDTGIVLEIPISVEFFLETDYNTRYALIEHIKNEIGETWTINLNSG